MDTARIHTLLQPFVSGLTEPQLKNISTYIDILQRWNARINLTAIRDAEEIVSRHWGESLFAPAARVTLIEANQRKATFLKEAARALTLTGINVFPGRAEDLGATADLVTLRAVEKFADVLPAAGKLVRPAGRLALLIGNAQIADARKLPGFTWAEPIAIPQSRTRVLFVGTKPKS